MEIPGLVAGHLRGNIYTENASREERQERGRLDLLCKDISKSERVAPLLSRSVWAGDCEWTGCRLRRQGIVCNADCRRNRTFSLRSQHWRQMRNGKSSLQMANAMASFEMREAEAGSNISASLCVPAATHLHLPRHVRRALRHTDSTFPLPRHFYSFRSKSKPSRTTSS